GEMDWGGHVVTMTGSAVMRPAVAETSEARAPLIPADTNCVWPFDEAACLCAMKEIASDVIEPSTENSARPVETVRIMFPDGGECPPLAVAALISLGRGVIIRVDH